MDPTPRPPTPTPEPEPLPEPEPASQSIDQEQHAKRRGLDPLNVNTPTTRVPSRQREHSTQRSTGPTQSTDPNIYDMTRLERTQSFGRPTS